MTDVQEMLALFALPLVVIVSGVLVAALMILSLLAAIYELFVAA